MLKHIHDRSLLFGQVLGIMVIITLISISFFGLYSVRSAADQMGQGKDVVADILPPPLYLIESQLQVYTLLHAKPGSGRLYCKPSPDCSKSSRAVTASGKRAA